MMRQGRIYYQYNSVIEPGTHRHSSEGVSLSNPLRISHLFTIRNRVSTAWMSVAVESHPMSAMLHTAHSMRDEIRVLQS